MRYGVPSLEKVRPQSRLLRHRDSGRTFSVYRRGSVRTVNVSLTMFMSNDHQFGGQGQDAARKQVLNLDQIWRPKLVRPAVYKPRQSGDQVFGRARQTA